jgi:hypothetical protein
VTDVPSAPHLPTDQVGLPLWVSVAQLVSLPQLVLIGHLLLDLLILQASMGHDAVAAVFFISNMPCGAPTTQSLPSFAGKGLHTTPGAWGAVAPRGFSQEAHLKNQQFFAGLCCKLKYRDTIKTLLHTAKV